MNTDQIQAPSVQIDTPVISMPEPLAYDIKQAAAALNVSTKTVRRLIARRKLTPCTVLRKLLIPRTQIEGFFNAN